MNNQVAQVNHPEAKTIWVNVSNICDKGKIRVSLTVNGEEYDDVFYSYASQEDGCVCVSQNLTPWLRQSERRGRKEMLAEVLEAIRSDCNCDPPAWGNCVNRRTANWLESRFAEEKK